jgi:oxygen-independent coproporphyrinogen-3 oxidase
MNQELLTKYGGNVPRYTSYPTAAQFGDWVTAGDYAAWLGEIDKTEPISLYLHIPYCHKLCWYCACHTNITAKYSPIARYVELLKKEMELVSKHMKVRPRVSFIHWGGGSPNMLSSGDFKDLMVAISKHFRVMKTVENAMEVDPRSMTREKAKGYIKAGINRVSLGVQDFNPHVQKLINRIQPFEMTRDIVGWLRGAGIRGINFDLMYGLPGQSLEDVIRNVDRAVELWPDRLAVFGYAHVPWMKAHQKMIKEEDLPTSKTRLAMADALSKRLIEHGYIQIGLDHYAKPGDSLTRAYLAGRLHRNFQGYTTDDATTLVALGVSSIGQLPKGFVQNTASMKDYAGAIGNGELATARGVYVTREDHWHWAVIEQLMCQMRVDLKKVCQKLDIPASNFLPEIFSLKELENDGLVKHRGTTFEVTKKGRPFIRSIAAVFDQYLQDNTSRHSKVV